MRKTENVGRGLRHDSSPEARVRWVLDFARRDPGRLSPRGQTVVWESLAVLARWAKGAAVDPEAIAGSQRVLRAGLEMLANGKPVSVSVPATTWLLVPPTRRPTGARHSAPVRRHNLAGVDARALPALAMLAFVDDLNAIDADRLRACPLEIETDGIRCGVVFLGTRGQRYCTPRHARTAAWQAYLDRHAAARKLGRKG